MPVPDVHAEVAVSRRPEAAFRIFVDGIDRWWPKANTFGKNAAAEVAIDPAPGGAWYERAADGTRTPWGAVLKVSVPDRLVLAWGISPETVPWRPEPDRARHSTVEVAFEPAAEGGTRVSLVHREIARHGAAAGDLAEAMASAYGWPNLLERFRQACAAEAD